MPMGKQDPAVLKDSWRLPMSTELLKEPEVVADSM